MTISFPTRLTLCTATLALLGTSVAAQELNLYTSREPGLVEPLLEAHLFDFDGDLYGRHLEVEFVAKLRDEEKFPDLATLTAQMHRDAVDARRILSESEPLRATA